MTPLLDIKDACKYYHTGDAAVHALDGVSLQIFPGEFVAIMGPSGSGKSTLMNIIGCLDRLSSGSYHIHGCDTEKLDSDELAQLRRETFGFVFQRYNLLENSTASENVEMPAIYEGKDKEERRQRAKELLTQLGLGDRVYNRPNQLSGGQQQRVSIARALMNDPKLILADEPTGALDTKSGESVLELLHKLNKQGKTIVVITHDEKVARNAQRIIRVQDGRILNEEILTEPAKSTNGGNMYDSQSPRTHIDAVSGAIEAVKMAFKSLMVNLFRTALTLLGIVIGVSAVMVMLAVGNGSKQSVIDQISAMGTNLLFVRAGAPGVRSSGSVVTLIPDDAAAIAMVPNVLAAVPNRSSRETVRYGNIDYPTSIQGTGYLFPGARDWDVAQGQFFSPRDERGFAAVAVLGKTVRNILFTRDENPVGRFIIVRNVPMQIIGVMESKGASSFGTDQDDIIFIPYTTGLVRIFGGHHVTDITVKIDDMNRMQETEDRIWELMMERHRIEDFNIRNMSSIIATASSMQDTMTLLLGVVAVLSLVVGGIGVMNIMLVLVTERTREIGIRMAVGARKRDILMQFNIESVVVCALGGGIGLLLGYIVGIVLEFFGVRIIFTLLPPMLAFGSACITGVLFGYLPARKAANLDPVVALSSE
ncbi:MAG: MacB family efflux pump subunit [Alphaproteobacteria bacterium]|nr:MacB family efflux pump subunit [Alphaproteobacteria bacterium]MCL2505835.1 MacB family efflux pump subunit [Alphaproteobacteria bacterium]